MSFTRRAAVALLCAVALETTMCIPTANAGDLPVPASPAPQAFPPSDPPMRNDGYQWRRVVDATGAAITVHKSTDEEIRKIRKETGDKSDLRINAKGYTVLRRNTATGEFRADIYLTDPSDQETLKHELLHARGWAH